MGYYTYFDGSFTLDRAVSPGHVAFMEMVLGRPLVYQGEDAFFPVDPAPLYDPQLLSEVYFPGMPGLWCDWRFSEERTSIFAASNKFSRPAEWLAYLLDRFFLPWGYVLHGQVTWQGEAEEDRGILLVENNILSIIQGSVI